MCQKPYRRGHQEWRCAKCTPCLLSYARHWTARILLEAVQYEWSDFVTLTYNKENYPVDGSLQMRDAQLFIKRLRYRRPDRRVRYYLVGEYGELNWRPHYHAILFSERNDLAFYEDLWPNGFSYVGPQGCTPATAAYCAGYAVKGLRAPGVVALKGRAPEFRLMSLRPGIGLPGAWAMYNALADKGVRYAPEEIKVQGVSWPLSRYLRERIVGWQGGDVRGFEPSDSAEYRRAQKSVQSGRREELRRADGWKAEKRLELMRARKGGI